MAGAAATGRAERPLDALNFFLADVRDGLGPYLAIYLLTVQKWDEASIGVLMTVSALAGIFAQTPAGALVDRIRAKRALLAGAAIIVSLSPVSFRMRWQCPKPDNRNPRQQSRMKPTSAPPPRGRNVAR